MMPAVSTQNPPVTPASTACSASVARRRSPCDLLTQDVRPETASEASHPYHRIRSSSSTLADFRLRKIIKTMARPIPNLGGSHGDHKDREHLANGLRSPEHGFEGHEIDVDRGKHQLD